MALLADTRRPALDGAIPLAAVLTLLLAVPALRGLIPALAAVVLVFAAAMCLSTGADRPGEPPLAWRLYGIGAAALAVTVVVGGAAETMPLGVIVAGLLVHVHFKAPFGVQRLGLLSAFGRRAHDARVGRTLELACVTLTLAPSLDAPALYVVAGWLLTAAAVAERDELSSVPEGQLSSGVPAPAA